MPYTNIHWIKLQLELLNDKRFIFDCNEEQRLLFLGLLLLAGVTKNMTPDDENFLKNRLNLSLEPQKIRKNLDFLLQKFPKTVSVDGYIKFRNFNKLHNPLKELQRNAKETPKERIEKSRIDKIIEEYIKKKNFKILNDDGSKNKELISAIYHRNCRIAKKLVILTKGNFEQVIKAMEWFGEMWDKKGLSWTLETIEKWLPEYMSKGESIAQDQLRKEFNLK